MADEDPIFDENFPEYREKNVREPVERYTIHKCLLKGLLDQFGSLAGQEVLDLACGHGHYTRQLKSLNCCSIMGIDISSKMIDLAQKIELRERKGIDYMQADVLHLNISDKKFDLVTGFYLFDYAKSLQELTLMIEFVSSHLKENQSFLGIIGNVVAARNMFNNRKYGITRETKNPIDGDQLPDGTEIIVTLYNSSDEPVTSFINYHYSSETFERLFREAGFKLFQWVPYQYDSNANDRSFYDDLLKWPPSIGILASK